MCQFCQLSQINFTQVNFNPVNFNQILSQYGFIDFVLPFLLIFSLVFMILELSNLLKTSPDDPVGRKLSALFALGFTLLSIYNQDLIKWLLSFIPSATIAIIGFSLLVISLAITNKKIPSWLRAFFAFFVVGIILWLAVNSLNITGASSSSSSSLISLLSYTLNYLMQSGILALLIVFLLIFIVLMWLVGGGEKKEEEKEEKSLGPILLRSR